MQETMNGSLVSRATETQVAAVAATQALAIEFAPIAAMNERTLARCVSLCMIGGRAGLEAQLPG
ncbi:MAG: hypothetical protein ACI835_003334 [Planctomycetota bacterium]|jgi:hypothetical protein